MRTLGLDFDLGRLPLPGLVAPTPNGLLNNQGSHGASGNPGAALPSPIAHKPTVFAGFYFNRTLFFIGFESLFGGLSSTRRAGLSQLLNFMENDAELTELSWIAYMLATVKHECADRWLPIEEFGKGAGHEYGNPVEVQDEHGHKVQRTFYGRGYVQLTWERNYRDLGAALGKGRSLVINPELVLEPETAYAIMSFGMRHGSFTGVGLSKYLRGSKLDYFNARKIINGLDQAGRIQKYAENFDYLLRASIMGPGDFFTDGTRANV